MKQLIFVILLASAVCGANFYVRENGTATKANAIGPSSDTTKCMTLATAKAATFAAGDTLYITSKGGDIRGMMTFPSSGTAANPIVVKAEHGETPIINASVKLSGPTYKWTKSASGRNEYYCELYAGGNPSITSPTYMWVGNFRITLTGTLGSLKNLEGKYGDNDGLGYSTIYIRDDRGDFDSTGVVVENGSQSYALSITANRHYVIFDSITFSKGTSHAAKTSVVCTSLVFKNCNFTKSANMFEINNTIDQRFINCTFDESYATTNGIVCYGTTSRRGLKFLFCKISNQWTYGIQDQGVVADTIDVINCTFYGIGQTPINQISTATGVVRSINNAFIVYGWRVNTGYAMHGQSSAGGKIIARNCYYLKNTLLPKSNGGISGITDTSKMYTTRLSGIRKHRTIAPFYISADDGASLYHFDTLASYANPKSVKLTVAMDHASTPNWTLFSSFAANNGISVHHYSHSNFDTLRAFKIQYVGAGSAAAMTITSDSLKVSVTGASDNLNMKLSNYTNIKALQDSIRLNSAYRCTLSTSYNQYCKTSYLHAEIDRDIKTAIYNVPFDTAAFLKFELKDWRDTLTARAGRNIRSLIWSYSTPADTVVRYVVNQGWFNGARNVPPYTIPTDRKCDMFSSAVYSASTDMVDTSSKPNTLVYGYTVVEGGGFSGFPVGTFQHGWTGVNKTGSQWMVDAVDSAQQRGYVRSVDYETAIDTLLARSTMYVNGSDSGRLYIASLADSSDLRIGQGSPLDDMADTTYISGFANIYDMSGKQITNESGGLVSSTLNIGAYGNAGPTINAHPQNARVVNGQTASFTVSATGSGALSYQWKKNGANVGTNNSSYSFTVSKADTVDTITVVVTDNNGSTTSNPATIYVRLYPVIDSVRAARVYNGRTFTISGLDFKTPQYITVGTDTLRVFQTGTNTSIVDTVFKARGKYSVGVCNSDTLFTRATDSLIVMDTAAHVSSVTPISGKRSSLFIISGYGFGTSGTITLGDTALGGVQLLNDSTIIDTVKSTMPRGYKKLKWVNNFGKSDSTEFRVRVPLIGGGE